MTESKKTTKKAKSKTITMIVWILVIFAIPGAFVFGALTGEDGGAHKAATAHSEPSVATAAPFEAMFNNANLPVIVTLIEAGADAGARDDNGNTPLYNAASSNANPSVIKALIEGGADPGARNGDGDTPLHEAAANANPAVILALLEAGADPGARNEDGDTPFDYAERNEALRGTDAYRLLNEGRFE